MPRDDDAIRDRLARTRETSTKRRAARRQAGVPGLRDAIRAKCFDCTYDPIDVGTALAQVRACTIRLCPLWPHRPGADPIPPADYVPQPAAAVLEGIRRQADPGRAPEAS